MQLLSRLSRVRLGLGIVALIAIVAATALLASGTNDESPSTLVGQSAMRVSIDPETGELVKSAPVNVAQRGNGDLARMLSRSDEGLRQVYKPDGSVMVNLEGRFMNASVARIDEDGNLHTECVHSAEQAEQFMNCRHTSGASELEVK